MGFGALVCRFGTALLAVAAPVASVRGEAGLGPVDVIEAAVKAYSDEHVARYLADVEREGVREHGFPRLTANLGALIARGRSDRRELFVRMMDAACAGAAKGKMKLGSSGNEFSVKELVIVLQLLERSAAFPPDVLARWRATLASVRAEKSYSRIPTPGANRANNWVVFGCASEQARIAAGCGGDAAFVEKYVADQLRWFDANGMYRDPNQPAVYDLVTRLQFAMILTKGYDGPSRAKLEELMDRAALPTLAMISACGEIPYGGRSNQFLHNNTFASALCRWYADRAFRKGDRPLAFRFLAAAEASTAALEGWLAAEPVRHVKNRYPRETGFGCETYAYFDKYMVTMGSWALMDLAFGFDFPSAPQTRERRPEPPSVFATTPDFHLVFARAGDYSAQWDYNADPHYDCDGLGRLHRAGAPVALCLSTPCARHPSYRTEGTNVCDLAISPCGTNRLAFVAARTDGAAAVTEWTSGPDAWRCGLGADGLKMTLTGPGRLALALPAFMFDGERRTDVVCDGATLTVRYGGWRCSYRTDGRIVDTGVDCWNRNGRYRRYEAVGDRALKVDVILAADP